MENWLNINQFRVVEWGLNPNEEKLCAYYSKEHKWITNRIKDSQGDYFCIAISKLILELPTIGKAKPNFSRGLNSLAEKQIFDKIVNDQNKKEVYYRFNPIFLQAWKDNSKKIASDLESKNLIIAFGFECYKNETTVTEINTTVTDLEQSVTDLKQSVTDLEPISINNQINNQINNNHNKDVDSFKSITKMKQNDLKKEFERLLNIYPYTTNNTNEKIAQAFGVYVTFNPAERINSLKAVKNYAATEQVKNQTSSKFIQSIFTFLTKSYTKFINELPKNFTFADKFEQKNFQVGTDNQEPYMIIYEQEDINKIKKYSDKFDLIKTFITKNKDYKIVENEIKKLFVEQEFEIIFVKMGGIKNIENFTSIRLGESLVDLLRSEHE